MLPLLNLLLLLLLLLLHGAALAPAADRRGDLGGPPAPLGVASIGLAERPAPGTSTPKWHWPMMHDADRNAKYEAGLVHAVRAVRAAAAAAAAAGDDDVVAPVTVVDVGAGAGLLSLLAARAGATRVLAVEHSPARADLARRAVAANNLDDVVKVLTGDALDIARERFHADILVHELFANTMLCERAHNIVPRVRQAFGASVVVPSRARTFAVLVDSKYLRSGDLRTRDGPNSPIVSGFDFSSVQGELAGNAVQDGDPNALIGSLLLPLDDLVQLSAPVALTGVDFERGEPDSVEIFAPGDGNAFRVTAHGTARAVLLYWEAQMAPGVVLSTSPFGEGGANSRPRLKAWPRVIQSVLMSKATRDADRSRGSGDGIVDDDAPEWDGAVAPGDTVSFRWGPREAEACEIVTVLTAHNGKAVSQGNRIAKAKLRWVVEASHDTKNLRFDWPDEDEDGADGKQ